jgi:arylformamidase
VARVIDISLRLDASYAHQTPVGVRNVQLEIETIKDYPGGDGQIVHAVNMRLHHGTHVDAPMHFVPGGPSIDQIPLGTFWGEVVLADLTHVGEKDEIQPRDLERGFGGRDIAGKRVLLRTDWNHHYGEPDYFERSPFIGRAAVHWLVDRKPLLVGYDYAHSKNPPDCDTPVYAVRTFVGNGIVTMGYVRNLDLIDPRRPLTLVAAPLSFVGVEASPVRALVRED